MANISDIIEQFILDTMESDDTIEISRNSLADYFNCAPSQINYVLSTRFTVDRGFLKESKRGGGGFIKISRYKQDDEGVAAAVLESVGEELTYKRMCQILDRLHKDKIIDKKEMRLAKVVLSDEALSVPISIKDRLRANAFKCLLIDLMNGKGDD
jgi:transcriptional regulator CtsR